MTVQRHSELRSVVEKPEVFPVKQTLQVPLVPWHQRTMETLRNSTDGVNKRNAGSSTGAAVSTTVRDETILGFYSSLHLVWYDRLFRPRSV